MRFLIEFDGPVCDVSMSWYAAHQAAAAAVGWSRLDQATFWRLTRTKGLSPDILPGAREAKITEYAAQFAQQLESEAIVASSTLWEDVAGTLAQLVRFGPCAAITLGSNTASRADILERGRLRRYFERIEHVEGDSRRRPAQLAGLAAGDRRTIVAAGTDSIIRAANEAGLFGLGISRGTCGVSRLHQAGAGLVYKSMAELDESLRGGASDLIRAGLLPAPLG